MQRVLLFLVTNFAILIVLSIAMQVLGIDDMLAASNSGFNTEGILASHPIWVWRRLYPGDLQIHGQTRHGCRIIEQQATTQNVGLKVRWSASRTNPILACPKLVF